MSKTDLRVLNYVVLVFLCLSPAVMAGQDLEILDGNYPISFYFRQTESTASLGKLSYSDWQERFSQLNGVMGKMLDEEVIGCSRGQSYFRKFKEQYPRQAVLLHANGGFRNPIADISEYHDGHWLYYNGAKVLDAIPSWEKQITIRVDDVSVFQLHPYRNNPNFPDDVGLCSIGPDGKPDWSYAEQTRLLAIDKKAGTITLERSVYGDKVRHDFKVGEAYVASHVAQNWGKANKLWEFNMATTCPRNLDGWQAADVWADELIRAMSPGGEIDFVDGFQFDVPYIRPVSIRQGRRPDANADTVPDFGIIDGRPVFIRGVERFYRRLREAFPDKLILADAGGAGGKNQRSQKYLNGMETEGFPELKDADFHYWSTAINYHRFWATRARAPRFHYGLMKYLLWPREPEMRDSRLIMAGTTLFGAAVPLSNIPGEEFGFAFDELLGGPLNQKGWLGKPIRPVRRLGLETPALPGESWDTENTSISESHGKTIFPRKGSDKNDLAFSPLKRFNHSEGGDLLIAVTVSAELDPAYPKGNYRELSLYLNSSGELPDYIAETDYVTPVDEKPFKAVFFMQNIPPGLLELSFNVEGNEPVEIHEITVHAASDRIAREFEHGLVLANPSDKPAIFNLEQLFPGKEFSRLQGTKGQDLEVNDGNFVYGEVILPGRDALFLIRR